MRSTFGSLNIANSGLFVSQRGLDVISHNVANAKTEGYSRQQLLQRASTPVSATPRYILGTGVEDYDVIRLRSDYLDRRYWSQNTTFREWETKESQLEEIEGVFNEPTDEALRKVTDELFSSLQELSKKPGEKSYRVDVTQKAITFADLINRNGNQFIKMIKDINAEVKNKVNEINSIAKQIAGLNNNIYNLELGNQKANDLRDQRNLLVDKLSSIVNVDTATLNASGGETFQVKIGGIVLVEHTTANQMKTVDTPVPPVSGMGAGDISQVVWDGVSNQKVNVQSGELKGLLDMRDGDGKDHSYRGIPYYIDRLNRFTQDFAKEFNKEHKKGFDFNGNPGVDFFIEGDCVNFRVNPKIDEDPYLIAASLVPQIGESDNGNVKNLIDFRNRLDIFSDTKGTPDDFIKAILSTLAVDGNQSGKMKSNQETLAHQTDILRIAETGVNTNEEMSNAVILQQAYNASASMITTLDKILDTTINRLGMVGR